MSVNKRYEIRSWNGTGPLYIYDKEFNSFLASPQGDAMDTQLYCDHLNMVYDNARYWMIEAKHATSVADGYLADYDRMKKERDKAVALGTMMYQMVQLDFRNKMSFEEYEPFNAFYEKFINKSK